MPVYRPSLFFRIVLPCLGAVAALAITSPAAAKKKPEIIPDYGPAPNWARYRELGEAAIRESLIDPDSAKFEWPYGYAPSRWTQFLHKRPYYGYITCGMVNSRNRMGGYVGATRFVVVIKFDVVLYAALGGPAGSDGMVDWGCAEAIRKGVLPRAPADGPTDTGQPSFGFRINTVAEGAYVAAIAPGGPAQKAGLTPGMVITHVNGVALKGLSDATIHQILNAAEGDTRLTLIGGASLSLRKTVTAPVPLTPTPLED
jgi:hypothetical protein